MFCHWLKRDRWTHSLVAATIALAGSTALAQDYTAETPAPYVAAGPERPTLPSVSDFDYSQPPATDLETRVRLLEDVIRTQSARQRELEEQISFQSTNTNVQPGGATPGPQPYTIGSDAKMSASW